MKKKSIDQSVKSVRDFTETAAAVPDDYNESQGGINIFGQYEYLDAIPFAVIIIDASLNVLKANKSASQYWDWSRVQNDMHEGSVSLCDFIGSNEDFGVALQGTFIDKNSAVFTALTDGKKGKKAFKIHAMPICGEDDSVEEVTLTFEAVPAAETRPAIDSLDSKEENFFDRAPLMIYTIDEHAVMRDANLELLIKTGYKKEEVIGRKIKDFLTEKSKGDVYGSYIPEFMTYGILINKEIQIVKKDGGVLVARVNVLKNYSKEGHLLAMVVLEDVTQLRQTQQALRESNEQYRKLVESLPGGVVVSDLSFDIQYISPQIEELLPEPMRENVIGTSILDWFKPAFKKSMSADLEKLRYSKRETIGQYQVNIPGIEDDYYEIRTCLLHGADDQPRGIISVILDITHSKKNKEALLLSEQKLQQISENSADIIWTTDKEYNINYVSKSVEYVLGYTQEEALHLPLKNLQSETDYQKKKNNLDGHFPATREPGQVILPVSLEIQHIHKNGNKLWTEMVSSPLYDENDCFCGLVGVIRDNSERKATELAIRESQELYRSLIEMSPEGIVLLKGGKVEFANREFIKMLKVQRENQIIERNFLDLVLLKDHSKLRKWMKRVEKFEAGDEVVLAELRRFDNMPLFVEVIAAPVTIKGMKSAQLFVRDVTERIFTEKALEKEQLLNENLIKSIPDFIYFKDINGHIIKVNRAYARAAGASNPEQLIGKTDKDIFDTSHYLKSKKEESQIIKSKKPIVGAIRQETWPAENVRWVSVTKMPLYGIDKEVIGTFGVSRNITRQKVAEEELVLREQRFRHFFSHVQVGMAIVNESCEIIEVNKTFAAMIGKPKKSLLNDNLLNFFKTEHKSDLKKQVKLIAHHPDQDYHIESAINTSENKSKYVIVDVLNLKTSSDKQQQILVQIVDIHHRKVTEEQLTVRNSELNNFVYKVSHDLRAPLLSVKGLINLMRLEKNVEREHDYTGMIEERVEKLDSFIRDILSHSKNLNTEVTIAPVDITEIINSCFDQMQYHANAKKIAKKISVRGPIIYSDEQRLREVMRNLISNAVIYASHERQNSFVSVRVRSGVSSSTIVVEDNGVGIKKTYQDKIFQMFYRANDHVEGSGIGLYIVQQSILKLGGKVTVESRFSSGTKFTITFPNHTPEIKE